MVPLRQTVLKPLHKQSIIHSLTAFLPEDLTISLFKRARNKQYRCLWPVLNQRAHPILMGFLPEALTRCGLILYGQNKFQKYFCLPFKSSHTLPIAIIFSTRHSITKRCLIWNEMLITSDNSFTGLPVLTRSKKCNEKLFFWKLRRT